MCLAVIQFAEILVFTVFRNDVAKDHALGNQADLSSHPVLCDSHWANSQCRRVPVSSSGWQKRPILFLSDCGFGNRAGSS